MKKQHLSILLVIISVFFLACNDNKSAGKFELNSTIAKSFSDLNTLDTFKIELQGDKAENSLLIFSILNSEGEKIYRTELPGKELILDSDPNLDLNSEKAKQKFIKLIAEDFFGEDDFLVPAVLPDDIADKNVPNKQLYEDLKTSQLNGFKYRLGKEKNIYIAWDETEKNVKVYYQCC